MKILITNHQLKERGGTELFTLEIATELQRRGHEVAVFTTLRGEISDLITKRGIPCLSRPRECSFRPDLIHGQHHLETMAAVCAWPEVPALYFMHGAAPWEEQPPQHPRILSYLAPSMIFGIWMEEQFGVSREAVEIVPNFFDPNNFPAPDPGIPRGNCALVFHNTMDPNGDAYLAIKDGCEQKGFTVGGIGASFEHVVDAPSGPLRAARVVFAAGRSAIEAMASGCAVILIGKESIGPLITPENFSMHQNANFCLPENAPKTTADQVAERLARIRQEDVTEVMQTIRATATLGVAVDLLETNYSRLLARAKTELPTESASDFLALENYLINLACRIKQIDLDRQGMLNRVEKCSLRAETWKLRAEKSDHRLRVIESSLQRNWWQRRLWRKLRRLWD